MNEVKNSIPDNYIFRQPYKKLTELLKKNNYSQVILLVDEQTEINCLPIFKKKIDQLTINKVFKVKQGEISKSFESCINIWQSLADINADRYSLLINLGGGMITDLGGFIASTYKRGIDFINIPTTLLAMVDASIGGKTGINLHHLKNQIGTIQSAKLVLFDFDYLQTLPQKQMNSGFAEVLKHGLIADHKYWEQINRYSNILEDPETMIKKSVAIKSQITKKDPKELGIRKHLNFGHTLGHAIESYYNKNTTHPLLHGEAIAHGMILESYLSFQILGLPESALKEIVKAINQHFHIKKISIQEQKEIISLLKYDKKNRNGKILFVLLNKIGSADNDKAVSEDYILKSFEYLNSKIL